LGVGSQTDSSTPLTIAAIQSNVVIAGGRHNCSIEPRYVDTITCWGSNEFGQLGTGDTINSSVPILVPNVFLSKGPVVVVDTTPDTIAFSAQTGVATGSTVTSNNVTIAGVNAPTSISVTGGEYSINGAAFTSQPGTVKNLDVVQLRVVASASNSTSASVTAIIGGKASTFTATTLASTLNADADKVFAWGERTFPDFFSPANGASQAITGYRYRAYSGGGFLAVNDSGTPHLYYLGPLSGNTVLDLGLLSGWVLQAGP
jgi:hypothetical protein